MIEQNLDDTLDDPIARKESIRARALVSKHLRKLGMANIYFVESLDDMLAISLELYGIARVRQDIERFRSKSK